MQDLRVAAISTYNRIGQQGRTIKEMASWVQKGVDEGAELILFPELCVSGYMWSRDVLDFAEPIPGPSTDKLVHLAGRYNTILCFGMLENESDIVYNTQVVASGQGILGKQRKIHMPGREYLYWRSGLEVNVVDIGKARLGIAICYDSLFMEFMRTLYLKGAEVLVMPFAYNTIHPREVCPEQDVSVMTYRVNCHSNGCYGIVANNAGARRKTAMEDEKMTFPGWAGVFGTEGEVLAWTREPGNGEAMVVAGLDARKLADSRKSAYFIPRCLNPSMYVTLDGSGNR